MGAKTRFGNLATHIAVSFILSSNAESRVSTDAAAPPLIAQLNKKQETIIFFLEFQG